VEEYEKRGVIFVLIKLTPKEDAIGARGDVWIRTGRAWVVTRIPVGLVLGCAAKRYFAGAISG
jgi:hypothetical protein